MVSVYSPVSPSFSFRIKRLGTLDANNYVKKNADSNYNVRGFWRVAPRSVSYEFENGDRLIVLGRGMHNRVVFNGREDSPVLKAFKQLERGGSRWGGKLMDAFAASAEFIERHLSEERAQKLYEWAVPEGDKKNKGKRNNGGHIAIV